MKKCSKCKILKNKSNFSFDKKNKDWFSCYCKKCSNIWVKKFLKTRRWVIQRMYSSQKKSEAKYPYKNVEYSYKELVEWVLKQENFESLYLEWVKSDYNTELIPSIDRINDNKWYNFKNIRLTNLKSNKNRYYSDVKKWINTKVCKSVIQYSKKWELIQIFFSISNASLNTGISIWNIVKVCKWLRKTAWWYDWKYLKKYQ